MSDNNGNLSDEFRYASGPCAGMTRAEANEEYEKKLKEYNESTAFRFPSKTNFLKRLAIALSGSPSYKYD